MCTLTERHTNLPLLVFKKTPETPEQLIQNEQHEWNTIDKASPTVFHITQILKFLILNVRKINQNICSGDTYSILLPYLITPYNRLCKDAVWKTSTVIIMKNLTGFLVHHSHCVKHNAVLHSKYSLNDFS